MKITKSLLILVGLLLLAGGGYWLYQKYFSSKTLNNLELISAEAIFTFETNQGDQTWEELVHQPAWGIFSQLPAFSNFSTNLVTLDSITGKSGFITKILKNKQTTISYHATGVDSFELLIGLDLGNQPGTELIEELKGKIPANTRLQARKYSDQDIWEYFDPESNRKWTITNLENVLLISASSFLIEEAIRLFLSENPNSLASKFGAKPSEAEGLGRLILSSKGLAKMLAGLGTDKETPMIQELALQDHLLALDLVLEEGQVEFHGPVNFLKDLSLIPSVSANFPEFEKLISNRTLAMSYINVNGIYEAQKLTNPAFVPKSTVSGEIQARLLDRGFLDFFSGEQVFLELEHIGNQENNLVLMARANNPEQIWAYLNEYINETEGHSRDFYLNHEILYFPEEEFPAHLFQGKYPGFSRTHLALVGEVLLMANSSTGMKMVLEDIQSGNTWNRSSSPDSKSINPSSGYQKIFLLPKIWSKWTQTSNPSWSTFLQKYAAVFGSFPYLSFRIHEIAGAKEASLILPFESGRIPDTKPNTSLVLSPNRQEALASLITYGPKAVLNFNDKTEDIVIQDDSNVLHLLNSGGESVYSVPLSGPIVSDIFQIDFYKNGKLQLLLATADKVYGIDRLGNSLPGFPFSMGNEKITHLNLVDYSNTRDYRFFIATAAGNLWLTDQNGKALDGWNPLKLGEKVISAPAHIRVTGRGDYMVAQGESGNYHLFNRRGEKQGGSPIPFGKEVNSPLVLATEGRSSSQSIHGITQTGEIIGATFSGEVSYRNQLAKENRDDRFELIPDQSGNSFLIAIRQFNKTQILNSEEKPLFSIPLSGEELILAYLDFGADRKILAVTDPVQGFGYLYDLNGGLLTETPLESTGPIQITYRSGAGQFFIRTVSGKQVFEYIMPD